jgi:hypothetical protein
MRSSLLCFEFPNLKYNPRTMVVFEPCIGMSPYSVVLCCCRENDSVLCTCLPNIALSSSFFDSERIH